MPRVASRREARSVKLTVWLGFGVVFGLLPLVLSGLRAGMTASGFDLLTALGGGELFIVDAVLAAGVIGEVVGAAVVGVFSDVGTMSKVLVIFVGVLVLLVFAANTVGYMVDSTEQSVMHVSLWLFVLTVVPCGIAIGLVAVP